MSSYPSSNTTLGIQALQVDTRPTKFVVSPVSVLSAAFWVILWVFVQIIRTLFQGFPSILLTVFSTSFQITLPVSSLILIVTTAVLISFLLVRYKYLTLYSVNTKASEKAKIPNKYLDIYGSLRKRKSRASKPTSNYLDEFLSAIKVFGYLERPVFHELTKNMTTQKLAADEIMYLDEKLGFLIVVDGVMQVYTKLNGRDPRAGTNSDDNDLNYEKDDFLVIGDQPYQLLNEVESGSPLSSLLSTLDLFQDETPLGNISMLDINSTYSPQETLNMNGGTNVSLYFSNETLNSSYPKIVARPKPARDTKNSSTATLAIVPNVAFRIVRAKYPKATSHIVTMVLTRLYKVSLNAIHSYFGMTRELLDAEANLNREYASQNTLPSYLFDSVIDNQIPDGKEMDRKDGTIQLDNKRPTIPTNPVQQKDIQSNESASRLVVLNSRTKSSHPGDLFSSVPLSRRADYYQKNSTIIPDSEASILKTDISNSKDLDNRPKSKTLNSANTLPFSDLSRKKILGDKDEAEKKSLRITIVENLLKMLGISEEDTLKKSSDSTRSSRNSSTSSVVASPLLLSSDTPNARRNFEHASRSEPMSPSIQFLNRGMSTSKFYNTIHESQIRNLKYDTQRVPRNDSSFYKGKIPQSGNYNTSENEFHEVKKEFSKILEVRRYSSGSQIIEQGAFNPGLHYVIEGTLDVFALTNSEDGARKIYSVGPGGVAGYLSTIVGNHSLTSIRTSKEQEVVVAYFSKTRFSRIMDRFYYLQLPLARRLKQFLSDQILTIDLALEWCHIPAGEVLYAQGDKANGFHIVLSGRFRVVHNNNPEISSSKVTGKEVEENKKSLIDEPRGADAVDEFSVLGEYGHGESVGEIEVLTASRRNHSLIAIRDSETLRIPRTLFEMLSVRHPSLMVKVSRIVANRMDSSSLNFRLPALLHQNVTINTSSTSSYMSKDYKTITILPTVGGLPVRAFADRLVRAFKLIGRNVIALDESTILTHLGRHAFDERLAQLKLSGYFAYLEEEYETIVYVCDTPLKSNWTSTCISQGDCILLLADAEDQEVALNIGEYERYLIKLRTTARTDLCLIHPEKYVYPGSTSIWLKNRIWVQGHHHIQMEIARNEKEENSKNNQNILKSIADKLSSLTNNKFKSKFVDVKTKAISSINKLNSRWSPKNKLTYKPLESHKNDFCRLARILSNEGVGLVLGGGGSRGISHVGVVVALEKQGIPVDLIGGTSMGSFVGGLYAKDYNIVSIYGRCKKFANRVASLWRMIFDLTYPVTSYITGYEFNRGLWKIFGSTEIEDFWIRYFCNTTNITNSTMDIHESGYLWRFIRASMSLAGLLPPITYNGCMLLDGGYLDNLPVMEMKKKGAKYIVAVDVGSVDDKIPMDYGDTLSGFWVLLNRWNPFSKHPNVPNMMDIQLRLAYVSSVNALQLAKKIPGVIYLRPPIDNFATLDFAKFDEIYHVGLAYADSLFTKWRKEGTLPSIAGMVDKMTRNSEQDRSVYRRNSI